MTLVMHNIDRNVYGVQAASSSVRSERPAAERQQMRIARRATHARMREISAAWRKTVRLKK